MQACFGAVRPLCRQVVVAGRGATAGHSFVPRSAPFALRASSRYRACRALSGAAAVGMTPSTPTMASANPPPPPQAAAHPRPPPPSDKANSASAVPQAESAWAWFQSLGSPRTWVAPMVDQSELPFRLLCMRHGAAAAYSPMLHSRLFLESASYRAELFTTCAADRPVLAQFCANDPDTLSAAAQLLQDRVDGVDLNLGCPQRIARRGRYGAFLMDDVELVERMVRALAAAVRVPVTVKIRRMRTEQETVAYAARLEAAGASLVAVHGRTREQKTAAVVAADWMAMRAVKSALRVPVLVNGNVRCSHDAERLLAFTGADGVLSADPLLVNPALFEGMSEGEGSVAAKNAGDELSAPRATPAPRSPCLSCGRASSPLPSLEPAHDPAWGSHRGLTPHAEPTRGPDLLLEYLELAAEHPVPYRMVKGHAFKMLNAWLSEHTDLRERLNQRNDLGLEGVRALALELRQRIAASGRAVPQPALSGKKLAAAEAAAAKEAAIAEQDREQAALDALGGGEYGEEEAAAGA